MNSEIFWVLELEFNEGRASDFHVLMTDMVSATYKNEPGTLHYEWNVSADGGICHIFERYADSAAVLKHLANFGENFAERFLAVFRPIRFVVYGSPSDEAKAALAAFHPMYMRSADGFSR